MMSPRPSGAVVFQPGAENPQQAPLVPRAHAGSSDSVRGARRRRVRSGTHRGGGASGREATSYRTSAAAPAHTARGSIRCCHSAQVARIQQPATSARSEAERPAGLVSSCSCRGHQRGLTGTSHRSELAVRIARVAERCQAAAQKAGTRNTARAPNISPPRLPLWACRDWYGRSALSPGSA